MADTAICKHCDRAIEKVGRRAARDRWVTIGTRQERCDVSPLRLHQPR